MVSSNFVDWQKVTFEDAFTDITAKATKVDQSEFLHSGKYPIVDQGQNFIAGYTDDEELVWGDDLPVVIFGDHTRILKYVDFPFVLGADGTKVLKPKKDILPLFAYYQLLSFDIPSAGYSRHFKFLKEYKFQYPSMDEQKQIASQLARADRLRQLRRTAHDLSDALLQSVFLEMFGDIAHSKWDKSELGELIEGFEAGVNYLPGSEGEKVSEWRVLKISAVTWGDFDPTESKAIREYEKFDETHIVRQGDLLISRANTTELVGAVSLVKIIPPKVLLPDKLWRVKFLENSAIFPEYTLHVLRQPSLRKIIEDLATGSSGSMKNISMEKAYTLPIPVPPLSLQEEFADVVARVESLRGRMGESTRQVEGLFESLLSQSFSS